VALGGPHGRELENLRSSLFFAGGFPPPGRGRVGSGGGRLAGVEPLLRELSVFEPQTGQRLQDRVKLPQVIVVGPEKRHCDCVGQVTVLPSQVTAFVPTLQVVAPLQVAERV
jgi:hypothetical protein